MNLKEKIRSIPDFPEPGIIFYDITTLIGDGEAYHYMINELVDVVEPYNVDAILVLDARGFLIGPPVAYKLKKGIVPIRKPHKLPAETYSVEYELEYGKGVLEMHKDALKPGMRVAILDDLLATGGTAAAAKELAELAGAQVVFMGFMVELTELNGREKIEGCPIYSVLEY